MKLDHLHFFIDPNRRIGWQACMQACSECDTHRGEGYIISRIAHAIKDKDKLLARVR